jgi:RNA polymerase sigma factor (sigma-70 family)
MEDLLIWNGFRAGNQKAFETLFLVHYRKLIPYGLKIASDRELVDDCIQDLFFNLWVNRNGLPEVVTVQGYLCMALRYRLVRAMKREDKLDRLHPEFGGAIEYSFEDSWIENEIEVQRQEKLHLYIPQLTKRQQEALHLRFYQKLNYAEISIIMDISEQAVMNLIYKSVKFLREKFIYVVYCLCIIPILFL